MAAGVSGEPGFLWPATAIFGFRARQAVQCGDPVGGALGRALRDVHMALVAEDVAADDEVDGVHVQRGGVDGVGAALLDDAHLVVLEGEGVQSASASASAAVVRASTR